MSADKRMLEQEIDFGNLPEMAPTLLPDAFLESEIAKSALEFHLPRYSEIPVIPLYRDQLIGYIDHVLSPLSDCAEGEWLTPSMVNNYVKLKLIPSPVKKQYERDHIVRLISICVFKQFLPIAAIDTLFGIQTQSYPTDVAFNYVATEVENAIHAVFSGREASSRDSASRVTRESLLVRSAANAFASKAYLIGYLRFSGFGD